MLARHKNKAVFIALILALFVLVIMVRNFLNALFPPPVALGSIGQLENIIALKFPPSSFILDSEYHRSWSPQVIAKVLIKKSDWNGFRFQKKIANEWDNGCDPEEGDLPDMKKRGWNVSQIKKATCVSAVGTPGRVDGLWITADLDRKSEVVIYLYYQG